MSDPALRVARAAVALATTLHALEDARFQPAAVDKIEHPQPSNRPEVSNPTLDITLDGRRWALSDLATTTEHGLARMADQLELQNVRLIRALARWNNERPEETP